MNKDSHHKSPSSYTSSTSSRSLPGPDPTPDEMGLMPNGHENIAPAAQRQHGEDFAVEALDEAGDLIGSAPHSKRKSSLLLRPTPGIVDEASALYAKTYIGCSEESIQDRILRLEGTVIADLPPRTFSSEHRCSALEARCSALEARCSALEARCFAVEARCPALEARLTDQEKSQIEPLDDSCEQRGAIVNLSTKHQASADICSAVHRAAYHLQVDNGLPTARVDAAEAQSASGGTHTGTSAAIVPQETIDAINLRIEQAMAGTRQLEHTCIKRTKTLQGLVDGLKSRIDTVQTSVGAVDTAIGRLNTVGTTRHGQIQARTTTHEARTTINESHIATLDGDIESIHHSLRRMVDAHYELEDRVNDMARR